MTSNAHFDDQDLTGAAFHDCVMAGSEFTDIDLTEATFMDVSLRRAQIRNANLSGVVIENARFDNQAQTGAVFHDCAMARSEFRDIDLSEATFTDVNLQRAKIRDANLSGVVIEDANITGLTIAGHDVLALIAAQKLRPPAGLTAQAPRAFLPTRDFAESTAFYETLGFAKLLDSDVAIFSTGPGAFILQRRYDPVWAENCMMQLMVDDLDAWWAHIVALDLPSRFGVAPPRAPATQPWGLRITYLFDPAGVLWHIAQRRAGIEGD